MPRAALRGAWVGPWRGAVPPRLSAGPGAAVPFSSGCGGAVALVGIAGSPAAALPLATAPPARAPARGHPRLSRFLLRCHSAVAPVFPSFPVPDKSLKSRLSPISSPVPSAYTRAPLSPVSSLASSLRTSPDSISPTSPECISTDFYEARRAWSVLTPLWVLIGLHVEEESTVRCAWSSCSGHSQFYTDKVLLC